MGWAWLCMRRYEVGWGWGKRKALQEAIDVGNNHPAAILPAPQVAEADAQAAEEHAAGQPYAPAPPSLGRARRRDSFTGGGPGGVSRRDSFTGGPGGVQRRDSFTGSGPAHNPVLKQSSFNQGRGGVKKTASFNLGNPLQEGLHVSELPELQSWVCALGCHL